MADFETTIGGLGSIGSELMARFHFGDELFKRSQKSGLSGMKLPFYEYNSGKQKKNCFMNEQGN
jgi:hypothetical protein